MMSRTLLAAAIALSLPLTAGASARCDQILKKIGNQLVDASCVESPDLTTTNPNTTPANNTLPGVPAGAWTPVTDRGVIAPSAAKRPPITKVVPGVQINARFADDPTGQGRFLLRLPDNWNGRLVVAGASGTRSEFNGDFAWATSSCRRVMHTRRRTKACSTFSSPRRRIRSGAGSTPVPRSSCAFTPTGTASRSPAGAST